MADTALIGYTGFVGQNLARQRPFDGLFNRQNLTQLAGTHWRRLVICGLPAEKWRANQAPEADLQNMQRLQQGLAQTRADQVILVSTVDVYARPVEVDEHTPIESGSQSPYGRHRHAFEQWAMARFADCRILRLPGLFGGGLKKNVLFDLLHDHQVEQIRADASFQWYPLARLADDIDRLVAADLHLANAATAPVLTGDLAHEFFPGLRARLRAGGDGAPPRYDMRSCHAPIFGGGQGYWMSAAAVTRAVGDWLAGEPGWEAPHGR